MNPEINRKLSQAIRAGDLEAVKQLLAEHPDVLSFDWGRGRTWLHKAAEFDNPEVVEALVAAGIDINSKLQDDPQTPLHVAVLKAAARVVKWLAEHGADVNAGGGSYPTPLSFAASGHLETVKVLVERGARVNVCHDNPPKNALSLAHDWKKVDIEAYLRAQGGLMPSEMKPGPSARERRQELREQLERHLGPLQTVPSAENEPIEVWMSQKTKARRSAVLVTSGVSERVLPRADPSAPER